MIAGDAARPCRNGYFALIVCALTIFLNGCGSADTVAGSATSAFVVFSPSAKTIAAKTSQSNISLGDVAKNPANIGQGCGKPIINPVVYEQDHSRVIATAGVSEAEQQEVAEYTEAAMVELRQTFGVGVKTAFDGNKLVVCIQLEQPIGAIAAASSHLVVIEAPSVYFGAIGRAVKPVGYINDAQAVYKRVLVHEATHTYQLTRSSANNASVDAWFTEGIAAFFEYGKSANTKDKILALIKAQNPISLNSGWSANQAGLSNYFASAAVVAYLFAPDGANNPISVFTAMVDAIEVAWRQTLRNCAGAADVTCQPGSAAYELKRSEIFTTAFESNFKERDGSAMRLRVGANNLQDTLLNRIERFW